jgi:hypothetical protein
MLYALRYESHSNNDVSGLVDALRKRGVSDRLRMVCIVISCSEEKINRLQVL